MKVYLTAILVFLTFVEPAQGQLSKAIPALASGAAAAYAAAKSVGAYQIFHQNDEVIDDLKKRGIDPQDGAIFHLLYKVDPNASYRIFFNPNVYAMIQIVGQVGYIPATINRGYQGQKVLINFYGHKIPPGRRVLITLYDDKWELINPAFTDLLQTLNGLKFSINGKILFPDIPAELNAGVSGEIKISNKDIILNPPKYLATADFVVPGGDDIWTATSIFRDKNQKQVGVLQFGQDWVADATLLASRDNALSNNVFWGILAIVLILVFGRQLMTQK